MWYIYIYTWNPFVLCFAFLKKVKIQSKQGTFGIEYFDFYMFFPILTLPTTGIFERILDFAKELTGVGFHEKTRADLGENLFFF